MSTSNLIVTVKNHVKTIIINNPKKKNAIGGNDYKHFTKIFEEDAKDDNIVVTIITSHGDYFSSGNDLSTDIKKLGEVSMEEITENAQTIFCKFVNAFLSYPKLIIGVVNGHSIGIGVTIASLCDIVYASDKATFQTPFVRLGLCIEGCASYMFPRILGRSKASEVLLLGEKLTAEDALRFNLISKIIPFAELPRFIEKLHELGSLPVQSLILNKKLIMDGLKDRLLVTKEVEAKQLLECQRSEFFLNNIMDFMNRKSKL